MMTPLNETRRSRRRLDEEWTESEWTESERAPDRALWRHFQMRPHGDHLLTAGASFWFFGARILVLAMALTEAIAWGYVGYLLDAGGARYAIAAFAGVLVFLIIWMIDVSLLTMDRASPEHAALILGETTPKSSRRYRTALAVVVRIGIVFASLAITAPYLSQLVFRTEIQEELSQDAAKRIEEKRQEIAAGFQAEIDRLDAKIAAQKRKYELEVAGKGLSGIRGRGVTATALEGTIAALKVDKEAVEEKRRETLQAFLIDVEGWPDKKEFLASKYNLNFAERGVLSSRAALEELQKRPEYARTELAIKAFLIFIFVGLLILKLFEPRSVELYLSEVLQQEYSRYRAGSFDKALPSGERSTARGYSMPPQRLLHFLAHTWRPQALREKDEAAARMKREAAKKQISLLDDTLESYRGEVDRLQFQLSAREQELDDALSRRQELENAFEVVEEHVREYSKTGGVEWEGINDFEQARLRSKYSDNLKKAKRRLADLQRHRVLENQKTSRLQDGVGRLKKALDEREADVRVAEDRLKRARDIALVPLRYRQGEEAR